MAGDSLGTMTVGVTANVSDAERALNGLANMLERFDRQQQARQRSAQTRQQIDPLAFTKENTGVFSGIQTDIGQSRFANANRKSQIEDLSATANRTRFAVLNLAYGIQDAATVFEHGGLLGAIRASANNMQGLAILFDKAAIKAGGLAAAFAEPEFKVIAFATTLLIGASALEKYIEAQKKAAEEAANLELAHVDPSSAIKGAGRNIQFQQQLRDIKELSDAEALIKEKQDQKNVEKGRIQENLRQQQKLKKDIENEEFLVNMIRDIADRAQRQAQQRAMRSAPVMGEPTPGAALTADEQELLKNENMLIAQEKIAKLKKELVETEKDHAKALRESATVAKELADAQKNLGKLQEEWKIDELNRQKDLWQEYERTQMKEKESDIEYRIGFLRKRRDQIVERSRKQMQPVGVASFESAEAYEALARSRMKQDPQTDLLQKIVKEEEKATKALEDIREQLDPGRRAKIAVLEKL